MALCLKIQKNDNAFQIIHYILKKNDKQQEREKDICMYFELCLLISTLNAFI